MDNSFASFFAGTLFGIAIALILSVNLIDQPSEVLEKIHLDAIENNVGTYYLDNDYKRDFRWLTKKEICRKE